MDRKARTEKLMVLGVDGLDPRLTRKYVDAGLLPNFKKLIEKGAQRHDLVMLGAQPTVTPPQWTTLGYGCNPYIHGITQFGRTIPGKIHRYDYNVDSRIVTAEPVWNCFVEAGKKTLVMHWPGGAWPPTSDREELFVIDGSAPGSVGSAAMQVDTELFVGASEKFETATFVARKVADAVAPCVINKLPEETLTANDTAKGMKMQVAMAGNKELMEQIDASGMETVNVITNDSEGFGTRAGDFPQNLNNCISPIKPATGWANAPEGAKEFQILICGGLIRRLGLIIKNKDGIYDTVQVYKSKKETVPMATLPVGKMIDNIIDDVIEDEKTYRATRHYKLMTLKEDGSELKLYLSAAMDTECDTVLHPKRLAKELFENVGPFPPQSQIYIQDIDTQTAMIEVWDNVVDWYIKVFDYMIETEGIEVIFSHLHSVDFVEHTFIRYMHGLGFNKYDQSVYESWMERLYQQCDRYLGSMLHYMEEGWTIMVTSDHAQVAPYHMPPAIGDMCGINTGLMKELGYTVLLKDEHGNDTKKIDWSKTRAVASQGNDIFINLKGREKNGIVDPADQYELEEQIMTDLYGYRSPETGKRVIALAVRNKDAVLLGYGGPTAGDICFWVTEGYNYDHCDSLSTAYGACDTSSSPIFIAAGPGLKEGYETNRVIRQVDLAATCCALLGTRMPADCEGAPVYQIFAEEF